MSQIINISDTLTLVPSAYDSTHSSYSAISSSYPVTNGYTDSSSTTYAYITCNTGSQASTYISYTFDTSEVPANATIDSIACSAKGRVSSTSYIATAVFQLYAGGTAKGSSTSARTTTATAYNLTPGTWTRAELDDIQVRYTGTRGTSNTTRAAYLYFYGATLTINYSISGIQYTITATSSVENISVTPALQDVMEGETATVSIQVNNSDDYEITDNGSDIFNSLVRETITISGSVSETAESFTTGFSGGTNMNFYTATSTTGNNFNYAIGHTAENPGSTASGSGSWTYVKANNGSTTETGYADYVFDFSSIPADAVIDSVEVKCYGAVESASQSTSHSDITLFSGSTQKGTMQEFESATNSIITINDPGTWTRAELQNAKLRFAVGYYGGHLFGITWNVNYTVITGDIVYTYTLTNVAADHMILIAEKGVYVPPEEDPQYTYHSLTISSIYATTNPGTGTTRVIQGTTQTVTITPSDSLLVLALDNGVDITNQLVANTGGYTYTLTNINQKHSLIFVFRSITYYFITSNGTNVRLFPDGQLVMLPGNRYKLNIVPNNYDDIITITDNNVDVTAALVREEDVDQNDNPIVSYEYVITNIAAAHDIIVTGTEPIITRELFLKDEGSWINVESVWKKVAGRWEEVSVTIFDDEDIHYLKKGQSETLITKTLLPSTYALSNTTYLTIADASNMYTDVTSDTYATITHTRASTSYSYYLYLRGFDFGQIPSNANVDSFTIRFKARESGLSTSTTYRPYLINNTTTITGTADVTTTTAQTFTFSGVTATWDTIKGYGSNFGIRMTLRRSASGTTGYLYMYGAELDVSYYGFE